jgi:hypothetical protein
MVVESSDDEERESVEGKQPKLTNIPNKKLSSFGSSLILKRKSTSSFISFVTKSDIVEDNNANDKVIDSKNCETARPLAADLLAPPLSNLNSRDTVSASSISTVKFPHSNNRPLSPLPEVPELQNGHSRFLDSRNSIGLSAFREKSDDLYEKTGRKGKSFDIRVTTGIILYDLGTIMILNENNKLKAHTGPIDQRALTSTDPDDLKFLVIETIKELAMEYSPTYDPYKLVVEKFPSVVENGVQSDLFYRKNNILNALIQKFRYISLFGLRYNRGFDGTTISKALAQEKRLEFNSYVKFKVMVRRINNLDGLYIVDLKRIKGDIWEFKKLYHSFIQCLDLRNKGL